MPAPKGRKTAMQGQEGQDRLFSAEGAGEFLGGVSAWSIRKWWADGRLPRRKIGRLSRVFQSDLLKFVEEGGRPLKQQSCERQ
jgi:hypothetical protein